MQNLWLDLRHGIRSLAKTPGFTLLAILALALGIGANTAIFSVVNGILLHPLPYGDPGRLVVILHEGTLPVSPADYLDWRKLSRSFEHIGAAQSAGFSLTGPENAERLVGMQVSPNVFPLLGVPPMIGRTFDKDEDQPAKGHVAVLSYQLWQRRFGSDRGIAGQQITLNGESYTVAGVMPETFRFAPFWATNVEVWVPLDLSKRGNDRGGRSLRIFARLRKGVSLAQAQSDIDVICHGLAERYPATNTNMTARVVPLQDKVVANIRPTLLVLFGSVGFVLLIACGNVANLMLVRASGRRKETAVRLALGSNRWGLIRHTLVEALLLSSAGALVGAWIATLGLKALIASLPPGSLPRSEEVTIDKSVLAFTILVALATGVFCGLSPALRAIRTDLQEALRGGGRGSTSDRAESRARGLLVVSEVALALMLLVGAGLMLRTFQHLQEVDLGFDPRNLLTLEIAAGGQSYAPGADRVRFFDRLRPRLESLPGVESVSFINHLPISGDIWTLGIEIAGQPLPPPGQGPSAAYRVVQPGYFHAMKASILQGRDFNAHDLAGATPVVIVNQALAKHHWMGEDPLGRQVRYQGAWRTVVGVVRDIKQTDWIAKPDDEIYLPYAQSDAGFSYMTAVIRTHGEPLGVAKSVADEVHALDKNVPLARVLTMEQVVKNKLWRSRLTMDLLVVFAGVAMMLAGLGIYGAISYSVAQRTSEIGLRMALGARASTVLGMVLRQGLGVAGVGIAIGLLGSWALSRAIGGLLYGVTATDPLTFAGVSLLLIGISAVACCVPALRAAHVDPQAALRQE